ncbi:MAG: helix-turn-helix domain-containing protein [Myxococcales bacterium]|nr:helix-turn-helix domain-containing protein [Myxococcales bacterium]
MPPWTRKQAVALRRQREHLGMSMAELADEAGISPATVSALESGTRDFIHQGTLDALDEILGDGPEEAERGSGAEQRSRGGLTIDLGQQIRNRIDKAVTKVDQANENLWGVVTEAVLAKLSRIDGRRFESELLERILPALGYSRIEVTRMVKDGGVDARCVDQDGKRVHVSAKRWQQSAGPKEVREIRGTGCDLAVLVCLSASKAAHREAEQSGPNIAPVLIISDYKLARACIKAGLVPGVEIRELDLPIPAE